MTTETLSIALTTIGMAAALIWLIIRLATKPLEQVVRNNTTAMERLYAIVDRHECELKDHSEHIAALDERTQKPARKRTA